MSFNVVFQVNTSPKEQVTKKLINVKTVSGVLRNETSILNPTIVFEGDISEVITINNKKYRISTCNYMYIEEFKRYYYITDIRSIRKNIFEIDGHVDVLMTFSSQIKNNTGIIRRQTYDYNTFLNDGSFKIYQNPIIVTKKFETETFHGFTTEEWVLGVAGKARIPSGQ